MSHVVAYSFYAGKIYYLRPSIYNSVIILEIVSSYNDPASIYSAYYFKHGILLTIENCYETIVLVTCLGMFLL